MTEGQFKQQITFSYRLLRQLGLFKYRVYFPNYVNSVVSDFRGLSYLDEWKRLMEQQLFDFQLNDHSLLQFKRLFENGIEILSYSYYENPFEVKSYKEFLEIQGLSYAEAGGIFIDEYGRYLSEGKPKDAVTPIRYDYAPHQYVHGRHPASHIHFGRQNDIRISTERVLSPLSFLLFVLRQYYPDVWQKFCSRPIPKQCARSIRDSLALVHQQFIQTNDQHEMVLK